MRRAGGPGRSISPLLLLGLRLPTARAGTEGLDLRGLNSRDHALAPQKQEALTPQLLKGTLLHQKIDRVW